MKWAAQEKISVRQIGNNLLPYQYHGNDDGKKENAIV